MNMKRYKPATRLSIFFFLQVLVCLSVVSISDSSAGSQAAELAKPQDSDPVAQLEAWLRLDPEKRPELTKQEFSQASLSSSQAARARQLLWEDYRTSHLDEAKKTIEKGVVSDGTHSMKFAAKVFGNKPAEGHSLFLSLHGGGGAPKRVNDGQWENQKRLYSPKEGVYVAPRAPTDTWNLWHQAHVDNLFRQIIEAYVVTEQVNPNRVYVMGYSAGGDGVYQVAPRMADSFAAAAMMAGHPNEASPLGLRNIGFTIHMGANDSAYNRNQVARQWGEKLDELQKNDPQGYQHETILHEGKGHWMDRQDAVALDFLARFVRNPNPAKVVWYQDDVNRDRFYWLTIAAEQQKTGATVIAEVVDQSVTIHSTDIDQITVRISDDLLDLDQPINFVTNGKEVSRISVARKIATLWETLQQTHDPNLMWPAQHVVQISPQSSETPTQDNGSK